jgi:hypothetical protein
MELVLVVWDQELAGVSVSALPVWVLLMVRELFLAALVAVVFPGVVAEAEPGVVGAVGAGRPCMGDIRLHTGECRLPPSGLRSKNWSL